MKQYSLPVLIAVEVHGFRVPILFESYTPSVPAKLDGPPEDCYEKEDSIVKFSAQTGNNLLDYYIDNDVEIHTEIQTELETKFSKI